MSDNPKELGPHTPPRFCRRDGKALVRKESEQSQGFDVLTGDARPPYPFIRLECPDGDDIWVQSASGSWVRL